jgi:hypothetical protein
MPLPLGGERLEPRQLLSVNAPDGVDLLALSGGGFKAMVGDAGMFAGVMKQRGIDVATLLRDDLAISANSGSTWFTNLLGYSDSFVSSLNDYERLFGTDGVTDMTVGGADGFFGVMGEAYRGYLNQHLDVGFENVLADFESDLAAIDDLGDLSDFLGQAPRNLARLLIAGLYDGGSSLVDVLDSKLSGAPGYSDLRGSLLDLFSSYDFKGLLGVASVALLDGLDWNTFMQRTVFAPDQVDRVLQGVNFYDGQGRTNALATQSLIYELAVSADEATVAPEGTSLGSDIVKVSVTNAEAKYGSFPERVYNFLPATATSRGNPGDVAAPWLPNIPSGDLQVEYDSTGLFNDESKTLTNLDFSGLSAFLASSISSSAAAMAGSYGVLSDFDSVLGGIFNLLDLRSGSLFLGKLSDVVLDYTKGLAPLVQATQNQDGSWRAGDPSYGGFNFADPIDTTSNGAAANAGWLRMADGGYFDNSSVTSGLSYLQANQNSWVAGDGNNDFAITLFVFSGIGETVSDTLRNRGFDNIGNVTQRLFTGGTQQEFKIPVVGVDIVDVSHPNSAVFDSTRATGVGSPIWSYTAPAGTPTSGAGFELKAYTMGVETVANNTMNIGAGYQGTVHLWNIISKTGPIPLDNLGPVPVFGQWSDYEVMYEQVIDALQSGGDGVTGAGLLATQLGINAAPTGMTLSSAAIAENAPVGTVVGTLGTVDADARESFTYALVSGEGSADNALFTIDGSSLKAAMSFDFEGRSGYSVRVRSTDSGGLTTDRVFAITVTNVKEAPSVTLPAGLSAAEDSPSPLTFSVGPFGTADAPASKRVSVLLSVERGGIAATSAAGVTVGGTAQARTFTGTLASLNRFFADPTGRIQYRPAPDDSGTVQLTATVSEAMPQGVLRRSATAPITITPANDAPVARTPAGFRVVEDVRSGLSWAMVGVPFADVDSPQVSVTLAVVDGVIDAATGDGVAVGGTATARTFTGTTASVNAYFRSLGRITYTTAADNTAPRVLTTTVSDGLASTTATSRIRITPVNDAPTLSPTTLLAGAVAGRPFEITHGMLRSASGARDVEAAPLRFRIVSLQAGRVERWEGGRWMPTTVAASSPLIVLPGGRIRWIPPAGATGTIPAFSIRASDGELASAVASQVSLTLDG